MLGSADARAWARVARVLATPLVWMSRLIVGYDHYSTTNLLLWHAYIVKYRPVVTFSATYISKPVLKLLTKICYAICQYNILCHFNISFFTVYSDREALCTGFAGRLSHLALLGFQTSWHSLSKMVQESWPVSLKVPLWIVTEYGSQGCTQDFLKRVSIRVWIYQYTLEGARNFSDYYEMSFLRALTQRNFKILAAWN